MIPPPPALPPCQFTVAFGDCDPAGIVYYPNIFRWMDATFHAALDRHGGHKAVCERLSAMGLGLIDAKASFQAPMLPGDALSVTPVSMEWGRKSLTLVYRGQVDGRVTFNGQEVRGLFIGAPDALRAGPVAPLRAILEG